MTYPFRVGSQERQISGVAGTVFMVGVGLVLVYFGFRLADTSIFLIVGGEVLLGVALGVAGIVMVVAPVVVLMSSIRAWLRRRQDGQG